MDILMPQPGETVAEAKITAWFKAVGDTIKPGDNLFEIETDKASMEVPSTVEGVLTDIRVPAGETAPVGYVVAVIGSEAAAVAKARATASPPLATDRGAAPVAAGFKPGPTSTPPSITPRALDPYMEVRTPERNYGPARITGGATVTPLARRLATEGGIDLSRVKGSGPRGRIVAKDIEQAVATKPAAPAVTAPATAPPAAGPSAAQVKALYADTPYEELPVDNMRRTIARRLTEAKQTVPHFYLTLDVALDAVLKLREEANAAAAKGADGEPIFKLSVNDFVIKALAVALQRTPAANAVWAEDRILRFKHSDIGVAVAIEGGLLTPVIRHAEAKSLSAISAEMKDFAARARARKLKPEEYQGGVSAISNLGMYGIRQFSAIINPPQSTILAVGAGQRRPVETPDGGVAFATQMTVTLSCDHRVVDGALGAELLAAFKTALERPVLMLV
jgi:pyruvate dehydrogenase E2 component (dihydrolipoamide acetyltransferase)